jgi:hypothetical protein
MISIDGFLIIFAMSLLFLRHTAVYKDPNKINYTPVVLALGFIGALAALYPKPFRRYKYYQRVSFVFKRRDTPLCRYECHEPDRFGDEYP